MQINTSGNLTSGGQISNGIEMNNSINTNGSFPETMESLIKWLPAVPPPMVWAMDSAIGICRKRCRRFTDFMQTIKIMKQLDIIPASTTMATALSMVLRVILPVPVRGQIRFGCFDYLHRGEPTMGYPMYKSHWLCCLIWLEGPLWVMDHQPLPHAGSRWNRRQVMTTDGAGNVTFKV